MITKQLKGVYVQRSSGFGHVLILGDTGVAVEYGRVDVVSGSLGGVFHHDIVKCVLRLTDAEQLLIDENRGKCCPFDHALKCRITGVISRAQTHICGTYTISGGKAYVLPDSYIPHRVPVSAKTAISCSEGDKVYAEICKYKALAALKVMPVVNFGSSETFAACISSVLYGEPWSRPFGNEASAESKEILSKCDPGRFPSRTDLRGKTLFTISDDKDTRAACAFSLERSGEGFRLGVHVADISEFVPAGSALEAEALERCRSLFRSNEVGPMFPKELSASVGSLVAGQDRLAVSVFIDYDLSGRPTNINFCESVVNVAANASCSEVDSLIVGTDASALMPLREKYAAIIGTVREMYQLASLIKRRRIDRGGIDYMPVEHEFEYLGEGRPVKCRTAPLYDSMLLARELLIDAGVQTGAYFAAKQLPMLYTAACDPSADIYDVLPLFQKLFPSIDFSENGDVLRRVVEVSAATPVDPVVRYLIDNVRPAPRYTFEPAFHYIHAADSFVRFHDPVGRYSDFLVQRAIKNAISDGTSGKSVTDNMVSSVGRCAEREQKCKTIEKRLSRLYQIECYRSRIGEELPCRVISVNQSGADVLVEDSAPAVVTFKTPGAGDTVVPGSVISAVLRSASFTDMTIIFDF